MVKLAQNCHSGNMRPEWLCQLEQLQMILECAGKNKESTDSCYGESSPKALNYICPIQNDSGMQQKETRGTEEPLTTLHPCNILVTPEKTINWLKILSLSI